MPDTDRLALLLRLSQTFNSSLNLDEVLNLVMDEVIAAVRAERGFVMLNDAGGGLSFRVARGMDQKTIDEPHFQVSRGAIESVNRDGLPILTMDALQDERFKERASVMVLGLRSLICVPLKNKERQLGIIYVDSRTRSSQFNATDLELVSAIASTAAIAIDNASLFNDLQQSKEDLDAAYITTLEGWARAIELRDHETEGHTRRVTEMTTRFARHLQVAEADLAHISRGALLHDIGKMGVSDAILRKPGPLTAEERVEMEMHPGFGFDMLAPIAFLKPAIDIPFCHHEKWDGSGYPRGLKGEDIPLAARIFCIVDVWDALSQDRYYRKAWPREQVLAFLREQSGLHFAPRLVEAFIGMLSEPERHNPA
ncbi:MAG: GAF domain-containing protein [Anaerolineales bacterium]|nr:GAF domain-containing protein [Anaerolineales bacterium]